jgi:hypothetical protein
VTEGTPQWEGQAEGLGHPFTPFTHPGHKELEHCRQLADWWAKVKEKEEIKQTNTTVHRIGGEVGSRKPYARREHRLICDAGPDVEPNGFFDCTVEVRSVFYPDSSCYYISRIRFCLVTTTTADHLVSTSLTTQHILASHLYMHLGVPRA